MRAGVPRRTQEARGATPSWPPEHPRPAHSPPPPLHTAGSHAPFSISACAFSPVSSPMGPASTICAALLPRRMSRAASAIRSQLRCGGPWRSAGCERAMRWLRAGSCAARRVPRVGRRRSSPGARPRSALSPLLVRDAPQEDQQPVLVAHLHGRQGDRDGARGGGQTRDAVRASERVGAPARPSAAQPGGVPARPARRGAPAGRAPPGRLAWRRPCGPGVRPAQRRWSAAGAGAAPPRPSSR